MMVTKEPRPTVTLEEHQKRYMDDRLGAGTWKLEGEQIHFKGKPVGSVSSSGEIKLQSGLPRAKRKK